MRGQTELTPIVYPNPELDPALPAHNLPHPARQPDTFHSWLVCRELPSPISLIMLLSAAMPDNSSSPTTPTAPLISSCCGNIANSTSSRSSATVSCPITCT